ncbi:MAG: ADP-forming succinate--CoA ligase subunit beta [Firmicutes bacterium]|nr:ADP-forming succinate--CoA ligase subunit beta [Bacillota bacterium]
MKIHEYQAKELLGSYGAPVPGGVLGETPGEIEKAAKALIETSGRCVLKAQVHSGGRGKAGGVKVAGSLEEAVSAAEAMLGMKLVTRQTGPEGKIVRKILVTEAVDVEKEFYVSVTTDSEKAGLMLILSAEGGTEIEETARLHPEKIEQIPVSVTEGLKKYECIQAAKALGLTGQTEEELADLLKKMVRLFMEKDCSLIEINPLVETRQGHLLCLDAKINFDDNALYRHPDVAALRDPSEEDPKENEAAKYGLNYIRLDGNIGCLVNGAGLAMATMDMIGHYGARPANFLDVGGSASVEKVTAAFEILLSDSHVKAILVNIFGGIMKCDVIAEGIVQAARVVSLHVPLVVRLEGTRVEEGRRILRESALPIIQASDMADGVKKAVSAAVGG